MWDKICTVRLWPANGFVLRCRSCELYNVFKNRNVSEASRVLVVANAVISLDEEECGNTATKLDGNYTEYRRAELSLVSL